MVAGAAGPGERIPASPPQPVICPAPRAREGRTQPEADLHRDRRRRRRGGVARVRRALGQALPSHHTGLAECLGASDRVHDVRARGPPRDQYDERNRGESQLRRAIKTKDHFPNEDAARKLIYLAIANAGRPGRERATGPRRCSIQDPLRRPSSRLAPTPPTQKNGQPPRSSMPLLARRAIAAAD